MKPRIVATLASGLLVVTAMGVSAQSSTGSMTPMGSMTPVGSMAPASTSPGAIDSPAANLRTTLDLKLGEHIILALKATDAALNGNTPLFQAYAKLLNTNGTDIGAMIGSVFGPDARDTFDKIWSAHNGYFVDYTTGVATHDKDKEDQAVKDLTEKYVPEFSKFIADATGLPLDAVTSLITDHVLQTKAVVDAQGAKDWTKVYAGVRTAYAHMQMIGDALASAIVAKVPRCRPG